MMPAWLSTPLMVLGLFYVLRLIFDASWKDAVIPVAFAIFVGINEKRRIRKVTLLEQSETHMIWRQDYRKKVKGVAPEIDGPSN